MNKKGQYDIIALILVVVGLLIMAPFMYKIANDSLTGFSTAINNTSPTASANVDEVKGTFLTWVDYLVALGFVANVILLFIFAFLADTHPGFVIYYILSGVFVFMFAPYIVEPVKQVFGMSTFSDVVLNLPLTDFIVTRFMIILLGIYIVAGIIMYAKFRQRGAYQI